MAYSRYIGHNPVVMTPLDDLQTGDIVLIDDEMKTISPGALRRGGGLPTALWGDPRALQGRSIEQVLFPIWGPDGFRGHFPASAAMNGYR